jgi:hypothetical protein
MVPPLEQEDVWKQWMGMDEGARYGEYLQVE